MEPRTIAKRWLGPKRTNHEAKLGFWEWYAYLFEENGNYYIGRALGNPNWDGGDTPYNEIGGPKVYATEDEAREDFNNLRSPEGK